MSFLLSQQPTAFVSSLRTSRRQKINHRRPSEGEKNRLRLFKDPVHLPSPFNASTSYKGRLPQLFTSLIKNPSSSLLTPFEVFFNFASHKNHPRKRWISGEGKCRRVNWNFYEVPSLPPKASEKPIESLLSFFSFHVLRGLCVH